MTSFSSRGTIRGNVRWGKLFVFLHLDKNPLLALPWRPVGNMEQYRGDPLMPVQPVSDMDWEQTSEVPISLSFAPAAIPPASLGLVHRASSHSVQLAMQ